MSLTADHILALAPDAGSAKAGSQLASPGKWGNLGRIDGAQVAVWGECQGSGKDPYRTQIDLSEPAFKCSCPSRKFPCKHGLGLYLLLAAQPALFDPAETPAWVADWLSRRTSRSEKKLEQAAARTPQQTLEQAAQAQKREDKRDAKVARGLAELQTWLQDLAREGLAGLPARGPGHVEAMAARLVDNQAGALASRLRRAGSLCYQQGLTDWQTPLARELAAIYLIAQAAQRADSLAPALQQDLRAAIGYTLAQDEVLAQPPVVDTWQVMAQHQRDEGRIRTRTSWLRGVGMGGWAQLLHFAAGTQGYEAAIVPGDSFEAALCFYPSAYPLRALVKERLGASTRIDALPVLPTLAEHLERHADALAANPFLERWPLMLENVRAGGEPGATVLAVDGQHALPVHPAFRHHWPLLAASGGQPVAVAGEWMGDCLLPLSVWAEGCLYNFDSDFAA